MAFRFSMCVTVLVVVFAQRAFAAEPPTWRAGVAVAKITPVEPLWMAGYAARTHPAEGAIHDLWVKVLALEAADGRRGIVVTADILGFPRSMSETICRQLASRAGLRRDQIMLTASHTHSGPVLRAALFDIYPLDDAQRKLIESYSAQLEETVAATVEKALAALAPATLSTGESKAAFAANRRANREADVAKIRQEGGETAGPSDHRVPVLAIRGADGKLCAVLFSYACHATTLDGYEWCGDYPGFAQLAVESAQPGAVAMFHTGCGADQNPMPRRSVELCRAHGDSLAAVVNGVLDQPLRPIAPQLATAFETIDMPFGDRPDRARLTAAAAQGGYVAQWATRLLAEIDTGKPLAESYPYPVQVWRLGGEQLWIAMGGEVVVDYSLRFEREYGPGTWITGYANDVMAYIPSERVRQEGGYEAGAFAVYGLPAESWTADIETRIAAAVKRLAEKTNY
jgi:hypothetical protein